MRALARAHGRRDCEMCSQNSPAVIYLFIHPRIYWKRIHSTCFHNLSVTETCTRCLISLKHFTTLSYPCPLLHMRWGGTHTQLCMMGSNFRGHIRPQHAQTGQPETTQRITRKYKSTHRDRARQVLRGNSGVRHAHLKEYMQIEPRITM